VNPRELLQKRQPNWNELDRLCQRLAAASNRKLTGAELLRFAALYRSSCADLALADAYQLPSHVVEQLQQLVARSHTLLYQGKSGRLEQAWRRIPQAVATDPYVHTAYAIFFVLFVVFCLLVRADAVEGLADAVVGMEELSTMEEMYSQDLTRTTGENLAMTGFYVWNNTGIGLTCFALGVFVLPSMFVLASNAVHLGAAFGYMLRDEAGPASDHFQEFVMSHGPCELSAIVLSAGAGLRIGMSWIDTGGLTRIGSLLVAARQSLPVLMLAVTLFLVAAGIEGLLSALNFGPQLNLWFKGFISWLTCSILMFYLVILGLLQPYMRGQLQLDPNQKQERLDLWI